MWQGIVGHDDVVDRFRQAAKQGRIAGTYLFVGPEGIGKRSTAIQLAKAILCRDHEAAINMAACGACDSCRLLENETHPDVEILQKRDDRQSFTIGLIVGENKSKRPAQADDEKKVGKAADQAADSTGEDEGDGSRGKDEGLLYRLARKPSISARRITILDDADLFNRESAAALLKTLEEPPPGAILILIGTSDSMLIETIRSRSRIVRFHALSNEAIADLLIEKGIVEDQRRARDLARAAGGSFSNACRLADEAIWGFRTQVRHWLSNALGDSDRFAKEVAAFVDSAGKEARDRRARLRQVIGFVIDYNHDTLHTASLEDEAARDETNVDKTLVRHDLCFDAISAVNRNANLPTVIDWWIDEMVKA